MTKGTSCAILLAIHEILLYYVANEGILSQIAIFENKG